MAKRSNSRASRGSSNRRSGGGFGSFAGGFLCAVLLAAAVYWLAPRARQWFASPTRGKAPVRDEARATAEAWPHAETAGESSRSPGLPRARTATEDATSGKPLPEPPFGTSEDGFEAAAKLYAADCASCHGTRARPGTVQNRVGASSAVQLFRPLAGSRLVGVTAEAAGRIYEQIGSGAAHADLEARPGGGGRPLTATERWQLALLLKHAAEPLPDPVVQLLEKPKA